MQGNWLITSHPVTVIVTSLCCCSDCFGYSVVCAIKTELMKRRPHVSRQEAMKILLQSWIRNHFEDVEKRRKPAKVTWFLARRFLKWCCLLPIQETVIEAVEDAPESELMVLDEVYSDESEDENVCLSFVYTPVKISHSGLYFQEFDITDDSESVQIDLFWRFPTLHFIDVNVVL